MKYMSLQEIAAACGGTYYGGSEFLPREVSSVVIDSRKAEKDSLFIAIRAKMRGFLNICKIRFCFRLCIRQNKNRIPSSIKIHGN